MSDVVIEQMGGMVGFRPEGSHAWVPVPFRAILTGDDLPAEVELVIDLDASSRPVCVELTFRRRGDGPPVTAATLREPVSYTHLTLPTTPYV